MNDVKTSETAFRRAVESVSQWISEFETTNTNHVAIRDALNSLRQFCNGFHPDSQACFDALRHIKQCQPRVTRLSEAAITSLFAQIATEVFRKDVEVKISTSATWKPRLVFPEHRILFSHLVTSALEDEETVNAIRDIIIAEKENNPNCLDAIKILGKRPGPVFEVGPATKSDSEDEFLSNQNSAQHLIEVTSLIYNPSKRKGEG